jgi:hypothetical protein
MKKPQGPDLQRTEVYRVEGIGRRGAIRYVKVIGRPGSWQIHGLDGLNFEVAAQTVDDAVRRARKRIPFRPIVIRPVPNPPVEESPRRKPPKG